jgi:Gpi18-like mannosyltransferase
MKIILGAVTFILLILCFQVNVLNNPERAKDFVKVYQNIHLIYLGIFLLVSWFFYRAIIKPRQEPTIPPITPTGKTGARKQAETGQATGQAGTKRVILYLGGILCLGFILRTFVAVTFPGNPYDIQAFIQWSAAAARSLSNIYFDPNIPTHYTLTYPPVYLYILKVIGVTFRFFLIQSNTALILILKLPAIITDIVTGYLIYRFSRKYLPQNTSLFLAGLYIFNPVTIFDSAMWGQVDSFLTLFILIGLFFIDSGRLPWASVFFVLAILTKPQGVFVLPVLIWELFKRKKIKDFIGSGLAGLFAFGLVILPFSTVHGPAWIAQQFIKTAKQFPYATVNAFNFFALFGGNLKYDSGKFLLLNYYIWGFIFVLGLLGLGTFLYWRSRSKKNSQNGLAWMTALLLLVGFFVMATRMHERYLFAALTITLPLYVRFPDRRILYLFAGLTVTNYINIAKICFDAFHLNTYGPNWIVPLVSLANVLLLAYLIKIAVELTGGNRGRLR